MDTIDKKLTTAEAVELAEKKIAAGEIKTAEEYFQVIDESASKVLDDALLQTTTNPSPEQAQALTEAKSAEKQAESALKVARVHQTALNQLVALDIRNYVAMLTSSRTSGNDKVIVAKSLERAIIAGLDYGVEVANIELVQKGKLAQVENSFAAHIARLKENGMVLIANNYELAEKEKQAKIDAGETIEAKVEEPEQEKNKLGLTPDQIEAIENMSAREKKLYLKGLNVQNKEETVECSIPTN